MPGRSAPKKDFAKVLESSAEVDAIFKSDDSYLGTNPYAHLTSVTSKQKSEIESQDALADPSGGICDSRKLAVLEALFQLVSREYSFAQLLSEILKITIESVRCEAGSVLEIDHKNQCIFFRAVSGRSSKDLLSFTIPMGQGVVGFVCESQQAMMLSSVDDSSIYLKTISDAVGFEAKNLACYPIVIRGITFGCIELLNRIGEHEFTDEDREILQMIALYSAKVIENRLVMASLLRARPKISKLPDSRDGEAA